MEKYGADREQLYKVVRESSGGKIQVIESNLDFDQAVLLASHKQEYKIIPQKRG